ncbi:MAG: hypothetical protein ABIH84_01445 [bacterium]
MLVKIYARTPDEVMSELSKADESSFIRAGSHESSRRVVTVNGTERPVRQYSCLYISVQNNWSECVTHDPDPLPAVKEIFTAVVVEAESRLGGYSRPRMRVRFYARTKSWSEEPPFLVFDLGEVGGGWLPQKDSILADLANAQKSVRVEVERIPPHVVQVWGRNYFSGYRGASAPQYLDSEDPSRWFTWAFEDAAKFLVNFKNLVFEHLAMKPDDGLDRPKFLGLVRSLWGSTALGGYLEKLGLQ